MNLRRFTAAVIILTAIFAVLFAGQARASDEQHQVIVCKYVGTPGVDERLQTGQNPIVVDSNALEGDGFDGTFPFAFEDAQGNSIAIRWAVDSHDGDISECPGYEAPSPEPTTNPTEAPTAPPTDAPTDAPTDTPSDCVGCGAPGGGPTPPNTATEDTATAAPAERSLLFLIAALLALTVSLTLLPTGERNRR